MVHSAKTYHLVTVKVYLVGPVTFTLPERKRLTSEKWIIQSPNKALKLEFTPFAAREENLHVGIIASGLLSS